MAKKGLGQSKQKGLSLKQKEKLADFCANFAVAWLAAGIITPYLAGKEFSQIIKSIGMSLFWAGFSLVFMLSLVKEEKK